MAERPVFLPSLEKGELVKEVSVSFSWNPGFAEIQKKKNIHALHQSACKKGIYPLLEISSKSEKLLGKRLSAFSLKIDTDCGLVTVESAFQGSKVFENGGPYRDIYKMDSLSAKRDARLKNSGKLVGFDFFGEKWPLEPKTAFYDWLYLSALKPHQEFLEKSLYKYKGFTDIEFNPSKSINCQARTCALLVSLLKEGRLESALKSKKRFISVVLEDSFRQPHSTGKLQSEIFGGLNDYKT